ncbi:MAG: Cna B-type domain-containing protein [Atopobiaceae bacterium]|nr:Cna B-type domain-containing protein [Atopobiaceae bacterium]
MLAILLSVLLALQGMPAAALEEVFPEPEVAEEAVDVANGAEGDAPDEKAASDEEEPIEESEGDESEEPLSEESAVTTEGADRLEGKRGAEHVVTSDGEKPVEDVAYATDTLEAEFEATDGSSYRVAVTFDEKARIPVGTELHVRELDHADAGAEGDDALVGDAGAGADADDLAAQAERAFGIEEDDRVLGIAWLDVSLEADGTAVVPAADVDVSIETDAFAAEQASALEVALLAEDEPRAAQVATKGQMATVAFSARQLGTVALASIVERCESWGAAGMQVVLWASRQGADVNVADAEPPKLEDGVESLGCYELKVDPASEQADALWIEATTSEEEALVAEARGGVFGYVLHDADANEGCERDELFGPEGTEGLVALGCDDAKLLLVRDSGYRSTTLSLADVTVEGMMPEGTHGKARDVTQDYADAQALESVLGGGSDAQALSIEPIESEADEPDPDALGGDAPNPDLLNPDAPEAVAPITVIAAYDITLKADGDEYQPDEEHPLTVTIASDAVSEALAEGKDVQLWHISDGGDAERIEEFELVDGAIVFAAPGFSTYLLAAQDEAGATPTSPTFILRAVAKNYARASTVFFVDEDRNPLSGTVTTMRTVSYTTTGTASDETNTVDMYEYVDKINPAIADEYEFSRVYLTLTASDEKDFRYIQVGDGTAIDPNGNLGQYRAYFYMNSIDQNRAGQDYYGTWYQLSTGGRMDDVYIEYYHVANASFRALDTRNDPVQGAQFSLYTDPQCYTPFEYKDEEVRATSDRRGLVSFGKIPRGTYYMKETVVPEGYRLSTKVHTVVVDGETPIDDVIHEDDDGSVIIADVLEMTLTKEWDDGKDHAGDSVTIDVYANGEVVEEVALSEGNDWTATLSGLDPNEAYMVSETCVTSGGADVTKSWIPLIEYAEKDPHVEYRKADEFRKDKQYVILTKTCNGTRALSSSGGLGTIPLEATEDGAKVAGDVTNDMLWDVETITQDGVLALRNVASGAYLDQNGKWYLNPSYPVPLYVRHINDEGRIRFYHRANLNNTTAYYLYMWYGPTNEGKVDRYMNNADQAGVFELYRKVNVRSVDVTITNKVTRYPIQIKNVAYPSGAALPGMSYDLYEQEGYDEQNPGAPLMSGLVAGADGYLCNGEDQAQLELGAGTYLLRQTGDLQDEGYAPLTKPIKFTITRGGALRVSHEDQKLAGFAYSTTVQVGERTLPVLQVPHMKPATVEVKLLVEGDYADRTREFTFALTLPNGVSELQGTVNGERRVFSAEDNAFVLAHGQVLRLEDVPATETYVLTQEEVATYQLRAVADTSTVDVAVALDNPRAVSLSRLSGTAEVPAHVTITNLLPNDDVPPTGIDDNVHAWRVMVVLVVGALVVLAVSRRRRES